VLAQLQVHQVDVLRQAVLAHEGDAGAVAARVLAQLLVHQVDVLRRVAVHPEGDAGAVGARVVACRRCRPPTRRRSPADPAARRCR
jgi:hypothetical protein